MSSIHIYLTLSVLVHTGCTKQSGLDGRSGKPTLSSHKAQPVNLEFLSTIVSSQPSHPLEKHNTKETGTSVPAYQLQLELLHTKCACKFQNKDRHSPQILRARQQKLSKQHGLCLILPCPSSIAVAASGSRFNIMSSCKRTSRRWRHDDARTRDG